MGPGRPDTIPGVPSQFTTSQKLTVLHPMPAFDYDIRPSRVIRTPDERFKDIPDFPYTPRYEFIRGLRYAFIDQTSGVFFNGRELSASETKDVPAGDICWETYLCLQ